LSIERLQADPEGELKTLRENIHRHECAALPTAVAHE